MKNRVREIDCTIAGQRIEAVLRQGTGLSEPGTLYVRCSERDCQYADLNQAPCPLRVEMFEDQSAHRLREGLAVHAGRRVCLECLAEMLRLSAEQVRYASWRVRDEPGVAFRPSRCRLCRRRRTTLMLGPSRSAGRRAAAAPRPVRPPDETPPVPHAETPRADAEPAAAPALRADAQEIDALVRPSGSMLCAGCLALATDRTLADTRRMLEALAGADMVAAARAECSGCGRVQDVVGATPSPCRG